MFLFYRIIQRRHAYPSLPTDAVHITVPNGVTVTFVMQWDTSPGTSDYDLYLYDTDGTTLLASSTNTFNNFEGFEWTNTGAERTVRLRVWWDGSVTGRFEVFDLSDDSTWQEHIVSDSSTASPSNATGANVISVGAVSHSSWGYGNGQTGLIASYSSRGPSNSGTFLPDMCGPTNTTGFTYPSGFGGTSAAAPNAAGAACAFWSADPLLSADAISWLIMGQATLWRDWGTSGQDLIYGVGGAILTDYQANTIWVARAYGNTSDIRRDPFYTVQAAYTAAVTGGRLLFFPGGNYPETAILAGTKNLTLETLENPANLGF